MSKDALSAINVEITVPLLRKVSDEVQVQMQPDGLAEEEPVNQYQQERFRLFRSVYTPKLGSPLLVQVLRRWIGKHSSEQSQAPLPTDELAFSLSIQQEGSEIINEDHESNLLQPGINQIIIFLDKDGIPTHYSIDGAED